MFNATKPRFHTQLLLALTAFVLAISATHCLAQGNISYTLQKAGKVSINIYDSSGAIVRELTHGEPRRAGKNAEVWDGRDNDGNALPPGDYSWKMLSTPGFSTDYVMSVGSSYKVDPDGAWWAGGGPGSHGGPSAIATDAYGFYVSAGGENIEPCTIKQSWDNKRIWSAGVPDAWDSAVSLVRTSDALWMLTVAGKIWNYDPQSGQKRAGIDAAYKVDGAPADAKPELPVALALSDGKFVLAYNKAGLIRWLDKDGHEVSRLASPEVKALASSEKQLFALTGNTLYEVKHTQLTKIADNLVSPEKFAVSANGQEFLVAQGGDNQQIVRLNATGKTVATYGKPGGRQDGLYDDAAKNSFRQVSDIKFMDDGGFVISEWLSAPRRVARFDRDGKWLQEWVGGQVWAPWIFPEPDNPSAIWMPSQWGSMIRLVVDYKTRTWKVHSTYQFTGLASGLIGGHDNAQIWEGRLHNGELYLCRLGWPIVIRVDRKNWKLVPAVFTIDHLQFYKRLIPPHIMEWAGNNESLVWTDANGDGEVQRPECKFSMDQN